MVALNRFRPEDIHDDFVPNEGYTDPEFAAAEFEYLWPKVWQNACRLQEIPNVGDYITYEIGDDSIIVVRSGEGEHDVKAFHNTCPHRGNQLVDGCGHVTQFVCSFHGWCFAIDGRNTRIVDEQDWGGRLKDIKLSHVQAGVWGGWAWINMDSDCQPLLEFLEPMISMTEKFEFEKLRVAWYKTTVIPANWKLVVDTFNEFYHVQATHSQMLTYTLDYSISKGMGRHGWTSYDAGSFLPVGRSPRLAPKEIKDFREHIYEYAEQFKNDLCTLQTDRAYRATQRLRDEVAPGAPKEEMLQKWGELIYQAAMEEGSGWPEDLTPEYIKDSGFDWHGFPNTVFLHAAVESVLWYRMRPNGKDISSCLLDVWSLERYAPGKEPPLKHERSGSWRDEEWPRIFRQDFENLERLQRGIVSRGFKGSRVNPVQEAAIVNFHRTLRRFMQDPHADDNAHKQAIRKFGRQAAE